MIKLNVISKAIAWLTLAAIFATTCTISGLYLYLSPKLPPVETLKDAKLQIPLRIYSSDNKLIGEFGEKRRSPISYEQIPEYFEKALLAAEDDRFHSHGGVDLKALLRATSQLLITGRKDSGASTITMQVARNFFLTRKKVFSRKFNEILLSLQIEKELSKQEILELYVNKMFFGNRAYGIQAAAQVYYGKNIDELSLAQLAMIAGLPKGPSIYNPIRNPDRALIRRDWILGRMLHLNYIDQDTYKLAVNEPVSALYHNQNLELYAPYIAEMARVELMDLLGPEIYTEGYSAYVTVNSELQKQAQQAVVKGLMTYDGRHGYRGPEQRLLAEGETLDETNQGDLFHDWLAHLQKIPTLASLEPAVVVLSAEKHLEALTKDGSRITIPWENGLKGLRLFKTANSRSAPIKNMQNILQAGDIVRVTSTDNGWALSQTPKAQAALVSLDPQNGAILSLVGGFDFNQSNFNRATQASRQPGSNFKPFVYTSALENGFTAATIVNDSPLVLDDSSLESAWRPENAGGRFLGPIRFREALYRSRNLASIRVLRSIGPRKAIANMDRFGFDEKELPRDLSLALGSYGLTPLQVAQGYAVLANGGYKIEPFLINQVNNNDGEAVYYASPLTVCDSACQEQKRTLQRETQMAQELEQALELELALEQEAALGDPNQPSSLDQQEQALMAQLLQEQAQEQTVPTDTNTTSLGSTDDAAKNTLKPTTESGATATASSDANTLLKPEVIEAPRVIDERVAYIIDSILKDVVLRGTATRVRRDEELGKRRDLAGKTGTTNGPKDAWFSGYNQKVVTTAWLGFDQNLKLGSREYGGTAALPIWIDFMRLALKDMPEQTRQQPPGIVRIRIDKKTGLRAQPGQSHSEFEVFREEFTPEAAPAELTNPELIDGEPSSQEIF